MHVEIFKELGDEIGPEFVIHLYDPPTKMKGVVVVDTTAFGPTGGGVRMLPDITTLEIARLARIMTYKLAIWDFPLGGGKAGIWHDPTTSDKNRIISAFGRLIEPLMKEALYFPGADMGTSDEDIKLIFDVAGMKELAPSGLSLKMKEGMPLEDHLTGFGVVSATKAASEFAEVQIEGSTVAIEGFGKVGGGTARYMEKAGAKVVAVSTIQGAIYNPKGIDVEILLKMRKQYGDGAVLKYREARRIRKEKLFLLPVDILVPGARPDVINKGNAGKIRAKLISEAANIPVTPEAEEILFKRGIISVPDFIANAGGVILGIIDRMGGTEEQAFQNVEQKIASKTKEVISDALREKVNPKAVALKITREKVMEAIKTREKHELEQIREILGKRFKIHNF